MTLLIAGLLLWSATHFIRSLVPHWRAQMIARFGEKTYKGAFSLFILVALVLMVMGWRTTSAEPLYTPAAFTRHLTALLMVFAAILFFSGRAPTRIKRFLRHPQLTGVFLWAIAHLLANGEVRSVLLFGGMALWAFVQIGLINRREGAWVKKPTSLKGDLVVAVLSSVFLAIFIGFAHTALFNVRPY